MTISRDKPGRDDQAGQPGHDVAGSSEAYFANGTCGSPSL
jgi:hypothetical protein